MEPTPVPVVVEKKVTWATIAAFVAPLLLAIAYSVLNGILDHPEILDSLPPWLKVVLLAAASGAGGFIAGYKAPHTPR